MMTMGPWELLEQLLSETKVYRGQGQVRYADLTKLFQYLHAEPRGNISTWDPRGKDGAPKTFVQPGMEPTRVDPRMGVPGGAPLPAKEGGWADVKMKVVPKVWNRWASTLDAALVLATSADSQYQQRSTWVQGRGALGQKQTFRTTTDMTRDPVSQFTRQSDPEDLGTAADPDALPPTPPSVVRGHARPDDMYDFIAIADMEGFNVSPTGVTDTSMAPKGTTIAVKRIAWTPSIGTPDARKQRLRELLAGRPGVFKR